MSFRNFFKIRLTISLFFFLCSYFNIGFQKLIFVTAISSVRVDDAICYRFSDKFFRSTCDKLLSIHDVEHANNKLTSAPISQIKSRMLTLIGIQKKSTRLDNYKALLLERHYCLI